MTGGPAPGVDPIPMGKTGVKGKLSLIHGEKLTFLEKFSEKLIFLRERGILWKIWIVTVCGSALNMRI